MKTIVELYEEWATPDYRYESMRHAFMAGAAAMASLFALERQALVKQLEATQAKFACTHRWASSGYCIDCGVRVDHANDKTGL